MKITTYLFVVFLVLLGIIACSKPRFSSIVVAINSTEVGMFNLVEAPAGHMSGTFVVSSITKEGSRNKDEIHNVSGSIYQDSVSLQIDNGILAHPTNAVGMLSGSALSLTFGNTVTVFHQMSQKEYQAALLALDHTVQSEKQLKAAIRVRGDLTFQLLHLNGDLQSFVKWGNERIAHVPIVRTWYEDRLAKYRACLDTIRPLAAQGVPSWQWQHCVLAMDNDKYDREQQGKLTVDWQIKEKSWEHGLDERINNVPELIADTADMMKPMCDNPMLESMLGGWKATGAIWTKDKSSCEGEVAALKVQAPLWVEQSKPVAEYRVILPKLRKAIADDMQTKTDKERELVSIVREADDIYKSSSSAGSMGNNGSFVKSPLAKGAAGFNPPVDHEKKTQTYKLGNYQISVQKAEKKDQIQESHNFIVCVLLDDRKIYTNESYYVAPTVIIKDGVPASGCQTMLINLSTGGNDFPFDFLILTNCNGNFANKTDSSRTEASFFALSNGTTKLKVTDGSFDDYRPAASIALGQQPSLCSASSPAMARLMVFQGQTWRPDQPGEFQDFYKEIMAKSDLGKSKSQTDRTDTQSRAAHAIQTAYYSYMSTGSDLEGRGILEHSLPLSWRPYSNKIWSDITKAAISFNPVKPIE